MQQLEAAQGDWYTRLVTPLSEQDKKSLQEDFTLANQRKNARDSKNIEQAGGNVHICVLMPNGVHYVIIDINVFPFFYFRIPVQQPNCTRSVQLRI